MDPKEKAQYLIDRGYIESDSFFRLADKIESVLEAANTAETTHIPSPSTLIEYTYESFTKGIEKIAQLVKDDTWTPDYLVGIVRGGAVPAVYLSHKLKIPVIMVHWNTRDKTDDMGNESNCWIPEDIVAGKNILIVDDIIDGGMTIKELLEDWNTSVFEPLPLANIRVAAMVYNITQDVNVHYCDISIDRNVEKRWFTFPWELTYKYLRN